jgi:hypothetical protein
MFSRDRNHLFLVGDGAEFGGAFFGSVHRDLDQAQRLSAQDIVYVIGDHKAFLENGRCPAEVQHLVGASVPVDRVPIDVHGVGVLVPRAIDGDGDDFFRRISSEHQFQDLTESNKPGTSLRKGIYLCAVTETEEGDGGRNFHLLRCSTNFHEGPTENFRDTDDLVVSRANELAGQIFCGHAPLNHVLAQIYENRRDPDTHREKKATIKAHSDKTKDMPDNAVMAFTTFYAQDSSTITQDACTRLLWRSKTDPAFQFQVVLQPNSMFFIPMSTNRAFTHEIKPPAINVDRIPVRMGYVIRCSKTRAVHQDGSTFLRLDDGSRGPRLEKPAHEQITELKRLYFEENVGTEAVRYPEQTTFSLNEGDYCMPKL